MIVSNAEIARVVDLIRNRSMEGQTKPLPDCCNPRAEDLNLSIRLVLVKSLQEMLAAGMYDIPPDMLADKIIGRALCDQVGYLCECRPRANASVN